MAGLANQYLRIVEGGATLGKTYRRRNRRDLSQLAHSRKDMRFCIIESEKCIGMESVLK